MSEREGPDFICVGLQKAGTSWLYDQLQFHPDFWMPPIKELNFFFSQFRRVRRLGREAMEATETMAESNAKRIKSGRRPLDQRDVAFFQAFNLAVRQKERKVDDYARLFLPKGNQLSGDVTPRFSVLNRKQIGPIAARFPSTKIVLMLRDPVERAWSHWRMKIARGKIPASDEQNVRALERFFDHRFSDAVSFPTKIAARWRDAFGEDSVHHFFLEEIAKSPDATRDRLITLLGGNPKKSSSFDPGYNRKAKLEKQAPQRSAEVQAFMRDRFETERRRCAKIFGGPANLWPDAPY